VKGTRASQIEAKARSLAGSIHHLLERGEGLVVNVHISKRVSSRIQVRDGRMKSTRRTEGQLANSEWKRLLKLSHKLSTQLWKEKGINPMCDLVAMLARNGNKPVLIGNIWTNWPASLGFWSFRDRLNALIRDEGMMVRLQYLNRDDRRVKFFRVK
jgi:hypothetical protein